MDELLTFFTLFVGSKTKHRLLKVKQGLSPVTASDNCAIYPKLIQCLRISRFQALAHLNSSVLLPEARGKAGQDEGKSLKRSSSLCPERRRHTKYLRILSPGISPQVVCWPANWKTYQVYLCFSLDTLYCLTSLYLLKISYFK